MSNPIRGQYQLKDKLGSGAMGEVYQARDLRLHRLVAVKILKAGTAGDPERQKRFIQEAQAASALNHPNIVTIFDIVSDEGSEVIVMEYVAGKTLAELIPRGGLRVPLVISYGSQIADALSTAHEAGIIHRDLKPGNIMVTDRDRVKILDFGLAKLDPGLFGGDPEATQAALTVEGSIVGTLCYMSPEQAQGKHVDARSDIFSFGAVLYELATGLRAFAGDNTISMLSSVLRDQPRRVMEISPDIPPQLDQVVHRCLAKNPDDRYQTMREVYQALLKLKQVSDSGVLYRPVAADMNAATVVFPPPASTPPTVRTKPNAPPPPPRSGSKKPALLVSIAAIVAAVMFGGWWLATHRSQPRQPAQTAPAQTAPPPTAPDPTVPLAGPVTQPPAQPAKPTTAPGVAATKQADAAKQAARVPEPAVRSDMPAITPPSIDSTPTPTPVLAPAASASRKVTLADGTPVQLVLADDVPLDAEPGHAIPFTASADVKIGDSIVIAKGAQARGEVYAREKRKQLIVAGRGTKLSLALLTVEAVNGTKLNIRATSATKTDKVSTRGLESGGTRPKNLAATKGLVVLGYINGTQTVTLK